MEKNRIELVKEGLEKKIYKQIETLDDEISPNNNSDSTDVLQDILYDNLENKKIKNQDDTVEIISSDEIELELHSEKIAEKYNEYLNKKEISQINVENSQNELEISNIEIDSENDEFEELYDETISLPKKEISFYKEEPTNSYDNKFKSKDEYIGTRSQKNTIEKKRILPKIILISIIVVLFFGILIYFIGR